MSKNNMGRPTIKTDELVGKLERAFMDGAIITEACRIAKIDRSTYYDWIENDPEFSNKMAAAQEYPDSIARRNLVMALKKEEEAGGKAVDTSKWWAERRMKKEFSTRSEMTGADGKDLPTPILSGVIDVHSDEGGQETK